MTKKEKEKINKVEQDLKRVVDTIKDWDVDWDRWREHALPHWYPYNALRVMRDQIEAAHQTITNLSKAK